MQENRYDGTEVLTEKATSEQVHRALANPANKTVSVHNSGSVIKSITGAQYEVQKDGSLRRINKPLSKKAKRRR